MEGNTTGQRNREIVVRKCDGEIREYIRAGINEKKGDPREGATRETFLEKSKDTRFPIIMKKERGELT